MRLDRLSYKRINGFRSQTRSDVTATGNETGTFLMIIHKKILEWQAAHPNITWIGWGIVWAIVLVLLFWPSRTLS